MNVLIRAGTCTPFSLEKVVVLLFRVDGHALYTHNRVEKLCLLVTLAPLWGVHRIFRGLDIRTDVVHREALILFTGTLGTFPQILLGLIECHLPTAIDAYVLARTDLLSGFCFLGQFNHQRIYRCGNYL